MSLSGRVFFKALAQGKKLRSRGSQLACPPLGLGPNDAGFWWGGLLEGKLVILMENLTIRIQLVIFTIVGSRQESFSLGVTSW